MNTREFKTEETPMFFHVGRGGRFNNPGYKTFEGIYSFDEVLSRNNNTFEVHRDKRGRFCKPYLIDGSGNRVSDTISGAYGVVDYDGTYDMDSVTPLRELDEDELRVVRDSDEWGFLPLDVQDYISRLIADEV